jgi:hypothetical protein
VGTLCDGGLLIPESGKEEEKCQDNHWPKRRQHDDLLSVVQETMQAGARLVVVTYF